MFAPMLLCFTIVVLFHQSYILAIILYIFIPSSDNHRSSEAKISKFAHNKLFG